jgi:hypothetical protein
VRRRKHTQIHIVQEEQLSHIRTVARSAQSPIKSQVEGSLLQGVCRVNIWLSIEGVIMRSSECRGGTSSREITWIFVCKDMLSQECVTESFDSESQEE